MRVRVCHNIGRDLTSSHPFTLGSFLVLHRYKDLDLNLYLHIEIVVTVYCLSKKYVFLIYFSFQLSWICCLVHKDWSTKKSALDRNRCGTKHKSQHTACYWTIIFIFLFSQLLPARFLLAVCFLPWDIKWRIAKTGVLWRFPSSKLFPLILPWNGRKRQGHSSPCLEFWKDWMPVHLHWSTWKVHFHTIF